MESIKGTLFLTLLPLIVACNSKTRIKETNDPCMGRSALYLYAAMNEDYKFIFDRWKSSLKDSMELNFVNNVVAINSIASDMADDLIIQCGGIDPNTGLLMNPCNSGEEVTNQIFSKNRISKLGKLLNELQSYRGSKFSTPKKIIAHVINSNFDGDKPFFSKTHLAHSPYAELCLQVLLMEQTIYYTVQRSFDS